MLFYILSQAIVYIFKGNARKGNAREGKAWHDMAWKGKE
jgi:hypothetical protein